MSKKSKGRCKITTMDLACRVCKRKVINVDSNAKSVLCWRCVSKSLNPSSVILTDLTREEFSEFLRKNNK